LCSVETVGDFCMSMGFEAIKQALDPAENFLFCEQDCQGQVETGFAEVITALFQINIDIRDYQVYFDEPAGRCLLVVKLGPERVDAVLDQLLDSTLPKNRIFSLYASRDSDAGAGLTQKRLEGDRG